MPFLLQHVDSDMARALSDLVRIASPETPQGPWSPQVILDSDQSYFVDDCANPQGLLCLQTVADSADIHMICVHPDKRRQSVGHTLLHKALEWLPSQGVQDVLLEVRTDNAPAIALYETAGFECIHRRKRYYRLANEYDQDAFILKKSLVCGVNPSTSAPLE